jgi:hypothetical protein
VSIVSERLDDTENAVSPMEFRAANRGTMEERRLAKKEFEDFVVDTWKSLVQMQKGGLGATPCTALFCRLDVGVMIRDGNPSYFVNEVERSLTTSLWMEAMPHGQHGILADTFGTALHAWLTWFHNPYAL